MKENINISVLLIKLQMSITKYNHLLSEKIRCLCWHKLRELVSALVFVFVTFRENFFLVNKTIIILPKRLDYCPHLATELGKECLLLSEMSTRRRKKYVIKSKHQKWVSTDTRLHLNQHYYHIFCLTIYFKQKKECFLLYIPTEK